MRCKVLMDWRDPVDAAIFAYSGLRHDEVGSKLPIIFDINQSSIVWFSESVGV
jgi:hypothetical protein